MKAAYINEKHSNNKIIIGELQKLVLNENDVCIKVMAVCLNRVDVYVKTGVYETETPFPFVLGRDAIGEVIAVGHQVTSFKKGDLVWTHSMGYDGRQGVLSEIACIASDRLYKVSYDVNPIELIASVHSAATAYLVLNDGMKIQKGQRLLVEGAMGHVGNKLVSLAKDYGVIVSGTCRASQIETLKALGVQKAYDFTTQWKQYIKDEETKFDHIVDTSGRSLVQDNLNLLKQFGQLTLITIPQIQKAVFDSKGFYMSSLTIKGFVLSHSGSDLLSESAKVLNEKFKQGELLTKSERIEIMSLNEVETAFELLQHQQTNKKIVIVFE